MKKKRSKKIAALKEKVVLLKKELIIALIIGFILLISVIYLGYGQLQDANPLLEMPDPFVIENREDYTVTFSQDDVNKLNFKYQTSKNEYVFCIMGHKEGNNMIVTSLNQPKIFKESPDVIATQDDPGCQIAGSIGSIHSHTHDSCKPSNDDLFTWGEMKNPEPLINAVQCGIDEFYIVLMPGEHEAFDFRSLTWEISG